MVLVNDGVDAVVQELFAGILNGYWDPERKIVDERYQSLPFPNEKINRVSLCESVYHWDFDTFAGFLETWPAVARFIRQRGTNPVDGIRVKLRQAWGKQRSKKLYSPYFFSPAGPKGRIHCDTKSIKTGCISPWHPPASCTHAFRIWVHIQMRPQKRHVTNSGSPSATT